MNGKGGKRKKKERKGEKHWHTYPRNCLFTKTSMGFPSDCQNFHIQSVSGNFVAIPFPTQKVVAKKVLFVHTAMMAMMMPAIPNSSINPPTKFLSFSLSSPLPFRLPSLSYLPHNPVVNVFDFLSLRHGNHTPLKYWNYHQHLLQDMEEKCGCWAVLTRTVSGVCKSSASRDSPNTIPRTSLVYDSGNNHLSFLFHIRFCFCVYGFYLW